MKRLAVVLCLFAAMPVWADECVLCNSQIPRTIYGSGGSEWPRLMPPKPTTTRWINDDARAEVPKCLTRKQDKHLKYEACKATLPENGLSVLSCQDDPRWINCGEDAKDPGIYKVVGAAGIVYELPDGKRVEFGLRSDGVLVWREVKP